MRRRIIIYSKKRLVIPKNIKDELKTRNTNIIHKKCNITGKTSCLDRIELYGYDKTLKNIIFRIDKMPIGTIEKQTRNK
jgi:DNA-binding transcriptional regulator/RsmH inhibitor MraZ